VRGPLATRKIICIRLLVWKDAPLVKPRSCVLGAHGNFVSILFFCRRAIAYLIGITIASPEF
jgi:hypothetical protein